MGIFSNIMNKIFHHGAAPAADAGLTTSPTDAASPDPMNTMPAGSGAAPAAVDVGAVLSSMAETKGGGGNYQSSIVDLLKLLDMDSSLSARKELANELNVHVGADGSAEENLALHRAVMDELAKNGGTVPANLRD